MGPLDTIEKWLNKVLSEDGAMHVTYKGRAISGVYSHIAQPSPGPNAASEGAPYVIFSFASGGADERVLCGDTALSTPAYRVYVVGRNTGFEPLAVWENRIFALLGAADVEADAVGEGSPAFTVVRENPFREPPEATSGGGQIYRAGGIYRFSVTP